MEPLKCKKKYCFQQIDFGFLKLDSYTPVIYAEGYIVFVFPFARLYVNLFVRSTSVTFVEFASKFCVNVSRVVNISATTYQKAFIFGP